MIHSDYDLVGNVSAVHVIVLLLNIGALFNRAWLLIDSLLPRFSHTLRTPRPHGANGTCDAAFGNLSMLPRIVRRV